MDLLASLPSSGGTQASTDQCFNDGSDFFVPPFIQQISLSVLEFTKADLTEKQLLEYFDIPKGYTF